MKRLFMWLVFGSWHDHDYEVIEEMQINRTSDGAAIGKVYVSRCKVCGKIESAKVTI